MLRDGWLKTGDIGHLSRPGPGDHPRPQEGHDLVSGSMFSTKSKAWSRRTGRSRMRRGVVPDEKPAGAVKVVIIPGSRSDQGIRHRALSEVIDGLQGSAPRRVPRYAAQDADRQDPAPRVALAGPGDTAMGACREKARLPAAGAHTHNRSRQPWGRCLSGPVMPGVTREK